jgi:hypothetical protein
VTIKIKNGAVEKEKKIIGENEPLVTLIRVAQEDVEIKRHLLAILSQNKFNRESILNSYLEELRLKQAPQEFISAIACLLDDDVAEKVLEILKLSNLPEGKG